ncbi:MAG: Phosphatidate cytidylyltransferase [uncultured Nocardioidaceae bacterium]|uniref:Phosphatidate cytidylyltransferase n=1 Tax=uncultured Nocardioidaceae bacterium TaxID=253824 RepID=A0A6J4MTQ0_9ACTN|nr:MAG: Phosphatidate cytidylyltransferase [uncultured Nocardioidaceae bacterium]
MSDSPSARVTRGRRAGRDLPAAIAVAVGLIALTIASLAYVKALFLILVVAAIWLGLREMAQALAQQGTSIPLVPVGAGTAAMIVGSYYGGPDVLVVVLAATALTCIFWRLPGGQEGFVRDVTGTLFCLLYLPFLASFVALLLAPDDGLRRVLTFIAVTAASDVGGYAIGVWLGRHPLAPSVSPKKSWEGFAGSVVASMAAGVACLAVWFEGTWWVGLVLGAAAATAATLGDLAESLLKRDLGIKDMSQMLPGHGGVMDRLDSLLATVSVVWLVLHFLVPAV